MNSRTTKQGLTLEQVNEALKKAYQIVQLQDEAREKAHKLIFVLNYQRQLLLLGISQDDVESCIKAGLFTSGVITKDGKRHMFRHLI